MCYEVKCSKRGKTTWGGCGWHVAAIHRRIPEGQHCTCRPWPGVKARDGSSTTTVTKSSQGSNCIIL
ncbi:hypothetical protein CDL15_Pgr014455 [Punica granatum]|uniref:Uncharacterized protein n=1 Tax=Punica granatum TaxID=22663 RepID=A0A218WFE0_PUNGR|nr:hypothetical protein CDL15_Pgr014455 [Punica granatum]